MSKNALKNVIFSDVFAAPHTEKILIYLYEIA